MTRSNRPDIDPANNGTLAGAIRFAFKKLFSDVNGMLPAQIMKYDRTKNRAQVQILVSMVGTDGSLISRPQVASIPVLVLGGGDLMLSFPLKAGDLGWIVANDRDISLFLQTYTQTPPNTARMANFADAMFIPDRMRDYVISGDDVNNLVLGTADGNVKIALGAGGVTIEAMNGVNNSKIAMTPSGINLTATGGGTSGINITGAGIVFTGVVSGFTLGGDINALGIPGGMHVQGNFSASGTITPNVPPP